MKNTLPNSLIKPYKPQIDETVKFGKLWTHVLSLFLLANIRDKSLKAVEGVYKNGGEPKP